MSPTFEFLVIVVVIINQNFHSTHGGVINASTGLGEDVEVLTLRQIEFGHSVHGNEIGSIGDNRKPEHELGTGIDCFNPGFFVSAPDGCNRCYCGSNWELTHRCTRAYCPPGFPSQVQPPSEKT